MWLIFSDAPLMQSIVLEYGYFAIFYIFTIEYSKN